MVGRISAFRRHSDLRVSFNSAGTGLLHLHTYVSSPWIGCRINPPNAHISLNSTYLDNLKWHGMVSYATRYAVPATFNACACRGPLRRSRACGGGRLTFAPGGKTRGRVTLVLYSSPSVVQKQNLDYEIEIGFGVAVAVESTRHE